jgi:hypothetical protein
VTVLTCAASTRGGARCGDAAAIDRNRLVDVRDCARWSSAMPIAQPPSGARPATAIAAQRTSTPRPVAAAALAAARSAASAFPVAPRSSCVPGATQAVRRVGPNSIAEGPGVARSAGAAQVRSVTDAKSRSYPSAEIAAPTVGSTRPPVDSCCVQCHGQRRASSGLTGHRVPPRSQRPHQLGVGAKAAVRTVDRRQLGGDQLVRRRQRWELVTATTAVVPERLEPATGTYPIRCPSRPAGDDYRGRRVAVTAGGCRGRRRCGSPAGALCRSAASDRMRR